MIWHAVKNQNSGQEIMSVSYMLYAWNTCGCIWTLTCCFSSRFIPNEHEHCTGSWSPWHFQAFHHFSLWKDLVHQYVCLSIHTGCLKTVARLREATLNQSGPACPPCFAFLHISKHFLSWGFSLRGNKKKQQQSNFDHFIWIQYRQQRKTYSVLFPMNMRLEYLQL